MQTKLIFVVAALGGLLFGYDTGVISGALLFIKDVYKLTPTMQGVVAGIALAGAVVGAMAAGTLSDRFGRRWVLFWTAILFVVGAIGSALVPTSSIVWLLIARVLVGVAIGLASMLTPLYLAELATAERRGGIVSLNQLCITAGILVSYLVDSALAGTPGGWRWMLGLGAVPGAVLAIGMLVLPESPRWLAGHGRGDEAEAVLRRVRGPGADVAAELTSLRSDLVVEGKRAPWSALLLPALRRPLIVGVGLAIFQQITGINTVIYFAPQIFEASGLTGATASILATAGVGVVNVLLTIASIWLIDRAGRRPLLLWSLGGMAASLAVLAFGFWLGASGPLGLLTALSLAAYVAFFADRPRPGVLAADLRNLPARRARPRDERRHHRELGFQPDRHRDVPAPDRRGRPPRHVPAVCRADAGRPRVHLRIGARDQGPQPGGDRGRAFGPARGRRPLARPPEPQARRPVRARVEHVGRRRRVLVAAGLRDQQRVGCDPPAGGERGHGPADQRLTVRRIEEHQIGGPVRWRWPGRVGRDHPRLRPARRDVRADRRHRRAVVFEKHGRPRAPRERFETQCAGAGKRVQHIGLDNAGRPRRVRQDVEQRLPRPVRRGPCPCAGR